MGKNRTIRELQARIVELEDATMRVLPPTFDQLTVCWADRTVTWKGRRITTDPDSECIAFPVTNDQFLLARSGWFPQ